jgi:signal peptidase I
LRRSNRSHLAREIVETIALTLLIFLAIRVTVQNFQISGDSMKNTLHNSQYVLVNKIAYLFHTPERGDVIVFHDPNMPERDLIKRIIGLPGDKIVMDSSNVWVNGTELNEPYIMAQWNPNTENLTVPANTYFVMGDNRPNSQDSRYFGPVPKDNIVGKATLVDWPINQWQFINTYSSVYSQIH